MKPIEIVYRNHTIVIRDKIESPSNVVTGTVANLQVTNRIIEVDHVDVTSRCRMVTTDDQRTEEARRFIDRIYPKGKSASESKRKRQ
jgi:hypothetical protein